MKTPLLALVATAALVAAGCKGAVEEDDGPSVVPKTVAFEGKVQPKYVGHWKGADGKSSLDLGKDGKVGIDQTITAANGKSTSHVAGDWLASGDDLLLRYPEKSGGQTTLSYSAKLTGDTLVLGQSGGRLKTTYRRG